MTDVERCGTLTARLADLTGIRFTFGYIGNLEADGTDARLWYAFAPHPGRVGKESDSIGGYATDELDKLKYALMGAIELALVQKRKF